MDPAVIAAIITGVAGITESTIDAATQPDPVAPPPPLEPQRRPVTGGFQPSISGPPQLPPPPQLMSMPQLPPAPQKATSPLPGLSTLGQAPDPVAALKSVRTGV